jgi:hypothetical protein
MKKGEGRGRVLCFDSENIGFLEHVKTKRDCHVIYVIDAKSREPFLFFDAYEDRINKQDLGGWEEDKAGTYEDGVRFLSEAKTIIIQNGVGYDFHIFEKTYNKLFNKKFNYFEATGDPRFPYRVMDTYTMSCTLNPERKVPHQAYALGLGNTGAHSIAAHGIRMGRHKPEHDDWSTLTTDMLTRVMEDTEIGLDFYFYLMKEWETQRARPHPVTKMGIMQAYYCELRVAMTMARQAIRGFAFDVGYAGELIAELDPQLISVEKYFRPRMPQRIVMAKTSYSKSQLVEIHKQMEEPEEFLSLVRDKFEGRKSSKATQWNITNKWTKKGSKIGAEVTKYYPEMRGYMEDLIDPVVVGAFTPIVWEDIPLGNRDAVKQILYPHGWRGVEFNEAEQDYIDEHHELPFPWSGKINEESIELWKEKGNPPEWCLGISDWYILESRRTQILNKKDVAYFEKKKAESEDGVGSWPRQLSKKNECRGLLPKCICQDTGITAMEYYVTNGMWPDSGHWRIPAVAFHAATNTFRMRHRNVVNIPSRGLYGKEMRKLFIAKRGHLVLGCDGAGLELRMLAHFMNDLEYTDTVLNGDIHTYNQRMAGLPSRDMAKTFIYAFLYGSGIPNLAAVCGVSNAEMGRCIARFKAKLPKLSALLEGVERIGAEYGYMLALDGRWGRIRSSNGKLKLHTCLNVLLQMTGSILMKVGHIIAEDEAVRLGVIETVGDFPIVAHVHDEAQMEVTDDCILYEYTIPKESFGVEEKVSYTDAEGRIYSSPRIIREEGNVVHCRRYYHPIGHCYAYGIREAGVRLGIRIEAAGEYMIGKSWLDTH